MTVGGHVPPQIYNRAYQRVKAKFPIIKAQLGFIRNTIFAALFLI